VWTRYVDTPLPSPFVYPLLLAWDWAYLDAGHAEERRSDAVTMRKAWSVAPGPSDRISSRLWKASFRRRRPSVGPATPTSWPGSSDDLGDLTAEEVAERALDDSAAMISALQCRAAHRERPSFERPSAFIPATDEKLYRAPATDEGLERIALRLLRTRGPVTAAWVAQRYGLAAADVESVLERLVARGLLRRGAFIESPPEPQYVHIAVSKRSSAARSRSPSSPAVSTSEQFSAVPAPPHHLHPEHRLVGRPECWRRRALAGRRLRRARVGSRISWPRGWRATSANGSTGSGSRARSCGRRLSLAWRVRSRARLASRAGGGGDEERKRSGRVGVALRENIGWLGEPAESPPTLDAQTKNVLLHLQLRGASFVQTSPGSRGSIMRRPRPRCGPCSGGPRDA